MDGGAELSDDGRFRWHLWRRWADGPTMTFIMLNPSTAGITDNDPTIRRCIGFAEREGCGGIMVVNLFPFRTYKPKYLVEAIDKWPGLPVVAPDGGERGLRELMTAFVAADGPVVAAWGAHPIAAKPLEYHGDRYRSQVDVLADLAAVGHVDLYCFGKTKTGAPRHPLYLKGDTPMEPWP